VDTLADRHMAYMDMRMDIEVGKSTIVDIS